MFCRFLLITLILGCSKISSKAQSLLYSNINSGFGIIQEQEIDLIMSTSDLVAGTFSGDDITIYHLIYLDTSLPDAVGIPDISTNYKILTYPNPFRSSLYLDTDHPNLKSMLILNTNGIMISKYDLSSNELDLSGLSPGMYLIKFFDDQQQLIAISKVVKY